MVVVLLVLILLVLLFGATAIKNAVLRSISGFLGCLVLAFGWSSLKSIPAGGWTAIGAVAALGFIGFAIYAFKHDAPIREQVRESNARVKAIEEEQRQRYVEMGMTEAEIQEVHALTDAGRSDDLQALFHRVISRESERRLGEAVGSPQGGSRSGKRLLSGGNVEAG